MSENLYLIINLYNLIGYSDNYEQSSDLYGNTKEMNKI